MDVYRVKKGTQVNLSAWDANDKQLFPITKEAGIQKLKEVKSTFYDLQSALFAERKHKILVVLQGMDTSGKDGTIRSVFGGLDPHGIRVAVFGKPTRLELEYDYMWRIHKHTPSAGKIAVFNRSHYEDVLSVRVRKLKPEAVWAKRFDHINNFERMLADEGVLIIKIFLHIDIKEQRHRLLKRIENPQKHWKLVPEDIHDRNLWPDYQEAYEAVLEKTSFDHAPWYVIPANRKWYRNLVITQLMVQHLESLNSQFPHPDFDALELKKELM